MCTSLTYHTKDTYFGRTFDYYFSYGEKVVITPRNFPLYFRDKKLNLNHHFSFIGIAHVNNNYPLYYDAVNEKGLAIAGLNFVGEAELNNKKNNYDNIAQFEFIPWILSQCKNVKEAIKFLKQINITNQAYNDKFAPAQLHWILADSDQCICFESLKEGIKIHNNPVGVLTNNPRFEYQLFNLNNYLMLSSGFLKNNFSSQLKFSFNSNGLGGFGLPGDVSSQSRFVRASFNKLNSKSKKDEISSVNQFFHIINSVEQIKGCCRLENKKDEITIYSSCCNLSNGTYYYTTYNNHQINAINMFHEDLNSEKLIIFDLCDKESINYQN